MSAVEVKQIDGANPPNIPPTRAEDRASANPLVRLGAQMNDYLLHRIAIRREGKAVDIIVPTQDAADLIGEDDLVMMLGPAMNGKGDVKEQGVHVQYLSADERLLLPLYISPKAGEDEAIGRVSASYAIVRDLCNATEDVIDDVMTAIRDRVEAKTPEAKALHERIPVALRGGYRAVRTRVFVPIGGGSGFKIPADAAAVPGADEREQNVYLITVRVAGLASPVVNMDFLYGQDADMMAVKFAHAVGLNADPRDFGALGDVGMRLADDAFHAVEPLPLARFRSKLRPFTVTMIAALNAPRLKGIPILAWTRAYLTSCGVLSDNKSKSHSEVAYTNSRPSKAVAKTLTEYHDRDSQRVLLAAYSIGALFGLEHLARDHTYKQGDEVLGRVNKAYEHALKTVLEGNELTDLAANRHETHRLTCHPFGLSQCYTLAMWGTYHHRIAEALQVRATVCPPALNRISLAVGVFKQVCSLPVGEIMKGLFGADHRAAEGYLNGLGHRRAEFSSLAYLYGWDVQRKVDPKILESVNRMMPMLAGYAEAFHTTDPLTGAAKRSGAALATSIENVKRDNGAMVQVFSALFKDYIQKSKEIGLEQFLINQQNAIRLALRQSGEEFEMV